MSYYLHHGIFFYEFIVAGCERLDNVYTQRANNNCKNYPVRVHSKKKNKLKKKYTNIVIARVLLSWM